MSIGAVYALIPVIIILILIAAAAGLRGGADLFTLLGFGTIMQMATGFGTGGAGKGISKATEFKEQMSTPTGGAKPKIAGLGKTVRAQNKTKNAARQAAFLNIKPTDDYLKSKGVTKVSDLNAAQRKELYTVILANPTGSMTKARRDAFNARTDWRKKASDFLVSTDKIKIGTEGKGFGVGNLRVNLGLMAGPGGAQFNPRFRHVKKGEALEEDKDNIKSPTGAMGKWAGGWNMPMAWTNWRELVTLKSGISNSVSKDIRRMMKEKEAEMRTAEHPEYLKNGYLNTVLRNKVSEKYEPYGPEAANIAEWRYGASRVPFVGSYGVAAATLLLAVRTVGRNAASSVGESGEPVPKMPKSSWQMANEGAVTKEFLVDRGKNKVAELEEEDRKRLEALLSEYAKNPRRSYLIRTYTPFPAVGEWTGINGWARFAGETLKTVAKPRRFKVERP